jgi:hypothetical protein
MPPLAVFSIYLWRTTRDIVVVGTGIRHAFLFKSINIIHALSATYYINDKPRSAS